MLFDAGSLINLASGGVLPILVTTGSYVGHLGPIVRSECRTIAREVNELISGGQLCALSDVAMSASSFGALLSKFNLGLGETECIAFGLQDPFVISCDDRAARAFLD
jgi:hypothetical protein